MNVCLLKGKIHGARVTDANVAYEGSITIDAELMYAAGIVPYEKVAIWSLTTGERLDTYAIPGPAGRGEVCMNGAAAHRIKAGERIIIAAFAWFEEEEARSYRPSRVYLNENNGIAKRLTGNP